MADYEKTLFLKSRAGFYAFGFISLQPLTFDGTENPDKTRIKAESMP
jgi:hypothetical protein